MRNLSRRAFFTLAAGSGVAAVTTARAELPATDWEEPDWDDSDRLQGGGLWRVCWYNRAEGFGYLGNDKEELLVEEETLRANNIEPVDFRPGAQYVVRWKKAHKGAVGEAIQLTPRPVTVTYQQVDRLVRGRIRRDLKGL